MKELSFQILGLRTKTSILQCLGILVLFFTSGFAAYSNTEVSKPPYYGIVSFNFSFEGSRHEPKLDIVKAEFCATNLAIESLEEDSEDYAGDESLKPFSTLSLKTESRFQFALKETFPNYLIQDLVHKYYILFCSLKLHI